MPTFNKKRHPASEAVLALRHAMDMTQVEFAVHVLHTTPTTVARYETNNPPHGEALIRLARIARDAAVQAQGSAYSYVFEELREKLKSLYQEEASAMLETA